MTTQHTFTINVPVSQAYEAASTLGGLRSWWTSDIQGSPDKDGELTLGFGDGRGWTMRVTQLKLNKWIIWTIISSTFLSETPWTPTDLSLRFLEADGYSTKLILEYESRPDIEATFAPEWKKSIESLVLLCETGKGTPATPKREKKVI